MKLRNVIFYVKDIGQSKDFYKKLDFNIVQDFGKFISYDAGYENLYFSIMESDDPVKIPGKQVCVFGTEAITKLSEKFKEIGIPFDTELYDASFGKTFSVRDIDGNKIEFVQ